MTAEPTDELSHVPRLDLGNWLIGLVVLTAGVTAYRLLGGRKSSYRKCYRNPVGAPQVADCSDLSIMAHAFLIVFRSPDS